MDTNSGSSPTLSRATGTNSFTMMLLNSTLAQRHTMSRTTHDGWREQQQPTDSYTFTTKDHQSLLQHNYYMKNEMIFYQITSKNAELRAPISSYKQPGPDCESGALKWALGRWFGKKNHFIGLTAPPTGTHLLQLLHESVSGVGLCLESLKKAKLCWYRFQQAMESRSAIVRCLPHEYDATFMEAGPIVVAMRPWRQQGPLG